MYFAVSSAVSNHQKPIDIRSCDSFDVGGVIEQAGEEWQARLRHNLRLTPYGVRVWGILRLIPLVPYYISVTVNI